MKTIHTQKELVEILRTNKHVMIDYFATWCGPCMKFAETYEQMSKEFNHIVFVKINVDDYDIDVDVSKLPTFRLYENAKLKHELVGIDVNSFKMMCLTL